MIYRVLTDLLVTLHFVFVIFVLFGGLLLPQRPRVAWLHLPAVLWAALVEINAWICPLTPWEQQLRHAAGQKGYEGGFVEHYVLPILYPPGLTPRIQWVLGAVVIVVNVLIYAWVVYHWRKRGGLRATNA